ncbi:MAG: hypothetical protein JXB48_20500 [Candidatus Latescibacteria bacterium]|nr:hypothetical protein [Candidatus Latescibacterota bacterium]
MSEPPKHSVGGEFCGSRKSAVNEDNAFYEGGLSFVTFLCFEKRKVSRL